MTKESKKIKADLLNYAFIKLLVKIFGDDFTHSWLISQPQKLPDSRYMAIPLNWKNNRKIKKVWRYTFKFVLKKKLILK